ncbi:MAG TPA: hypothetical protein VJR92_07415 [Gemmatimonadaceae bacterium]|nr:hypothetical protein [Gemmatimonadaceae bacterium]
MNPRHYSIVAALGFAVTACKDSPRNAPAADLTVSVRSGNIAAPDSIAPGWTRVRVEEDGVGHIVVAFRLPNATTDADVAKFLAALDTTATTPPSGVAMGGPEIGDTADVVVNLTPGRYVFGCVSRDASGHRHASIGEAKSFVVTSAAIAPARAAPPVATHELRMTEFTYAGIDTWRAGAQNIRILNVGKQDHQLRLVRLNPGSTLEQWVVEPEQHGTPVVGVARMGPGEVVYMPADLPPGNYIAYCLIPDAATKRAHVEIGMLKPIQVQ